MDKDWIEFSPKITQVRSWNTIAKGSIGQLTNLACSKEEPVADKTETSRTEEFDGQKTNIYWWISSSKTPLARRGNTYRDELSIKRGGLIVDRRQIISKDELLSNFVPSKSQNIPELLNQRKTEQIQGYPGPATSMTLSA